MKVIKELPVVMDNAEAVVKTGDHIRITGTIYVEREMQEYGPGPCLVDGISEYDYFEWLPYSG